MSHDFERFEGFNQNYRNEHRKLKQGRTQRRIEKKELFKGLDDPIKWDVVDGYAQYSGKNKWTFTRWII